METAIEVGDKKMSTDGANQDKTVSFIIPISFSENSETTFHRNNQSFNLQDALHSDKSNPCTVGNNRLIVAETAHACVAEDQSALDKILANSSDNNGPDAACRQMHTELSAVHTTESCTHLAKEKVGNTGMCKEHDASGGGDAGLSCALGGLASTFNWDSKASSEYSQTTKDEAAASTGASYSDALVKTGQQHKDKEHSLSDRTTCLDSGSNCDGDSISQPLCTLSTSVSLSNKLTDGKGVHFCNTSTGNSFEQYSPVPCSSLPNEDSLCFASSSLYCGQVEVEEMEIDGSDGYSTVLSSANSKYENAHSGFGSDGNSARKSLHQPVNGSLKIEEATVELEADSAEMQCVFLPETEDRQSCPGRIKSDGCPSCFDTWSFGGNTALLKVKQDTESCVEAGLETSDVDMHTAACTERRDLFPSTGSLSVGNCDGCHAKEANSPDCNVPLIVAHPVGLISGAVEHSMGYTKEAAECALKAELQHKDNSDQCTANTDYSPADDAEGLQHATLRAEQPPTTGNEREIAMTMEKGEASLNTVHSYTCSKSLCSSGVSPCEEKQSEDLLIAAVSLQPEKKLVCNSNVAEQKMRTEMVIVDESCTQFTEVQGHCSTLCKRSTGCAATCEIANFSVSQQSPSVEDFSSKIKVLRMESEVKTFQAVVSFKSPGNSILSTNMKQGEVHSHCFFGLESTVDHITSHNAVKESFPEREKKDKRTDEADKQCLFISDIFGQRGEAHCLSEKELFDHTSELYTAKQAGEHLLHTQVQSREVSASNPIQLCGESCHSIVKHCEGINCIISSHQNMQFVSASETPDCKMEDNEDVQKAALPDTERYTSNAQHLEKSVFFASDDVENNISLTLSQQLNISTEKAAAYMKVKSAFRDVQGDTLICGISDQCGETGDFRLDEGSGTDISISLHSEHQTEGHHLVMTTVAGVAVNTAACIKAHQCDSLHACSLVPKEHSSHFLSLHNENLADSVLELQQTRPAEKVHTVDTSLGNINQGERAYKYSFDSLCIDAHISPCHNKGPACTSLKADEKAAGLEKKTSKTCQSVELPNVNDEAVCISNASCIVKVDCLSKSGSFAESSMPLLNEPCASVAELEKRETDTEIQKVALQSIICPKVVDVSGNICHFYNEATAAFTSQHFDQQLKNSETDLHSNADYMDIFYPISDSCDTGVCYSNHSYSSGKADSLPAENCRFLANSLLNGKQQNFKIKTCMQSISEVDEAAVSIDNDRQDKFLINKSAETMNRSDRNISLHINHQPAKGHLETEVSSVCMVMSQADAQIAEVQPIPFASPNNAKQCQGKAESPIHRDNGKHNLSLQVEPSNCSCITEKVLDIEVQDSQCMLEQIVPSEDINARKRSHCEEEQSFLLEHIKSTDCNELLQIDQCADRDLKKQFAEMEISHVDSVITELEVHDSVIASPKIDSESMGGCSSKLQLNNASKGEDPGTVKWRELQDADISKMHDKGEIPFNSTHCLKKAVFCITEECNYPLDSITVTAGQHSLESVVEVRKSVYLAQSPEVQGKCVCSSNTIQQELDIECPSKKSNAQTSTTSSQTCQSVCQLLQESTSAFTERQTAESDEFVLSQHSDRYHEDDQSPCWSNPKETSPSSAVHSKELKSLWSALQVDYEVSQYEQDMVDNSDSRREQVVLEACNGNTQKVPCKEKVGFSRTEMSDSTTDISMQSYPHCRTSLHFDQQIPHYASKIEKQIDVETDVAVVANVVISGEQKQELYLTSTSHCGTGPQCSDEGKCTESLVDICTDTADLLILKGHRENISYSDAGQNEEKVDCPVLKKAPLCVNHNSAIGDVRAEQTVNMETNEVNFKESLLLEAEGSSVFTKSILKYKGKYDFSADPSSCSDTIVSFHFKELLASTCPKKESEIKLDEKLGLCGVPVNTSKCLDGADCPSTVKSRCSDYNTLLDKSQQIDSGIVNMKEWVLGLEEEKSLQSTKPEEVWSRHFCPSSTSQVKGKDCLVIEDSSCIATSEMKPQASCSLGIEKYVKDKLDKAELKKKLVPDLYTEKYSCSHTRHFGRGDLLDEVEGDPISLAETTFGSVTQELAADQDEVGMQTMGIYEKYHHSLSLSATENEVISVHSNFKSSSCLGAVSMTPFDAFEDQKPFKLGTVVTNKIQVDSVDMIKLVGEMETSHKEKMLASLDNFTAPVSDPIKEKLIKGTAYTLSSCASVNSNSLAETAFQGQLTSVKVPEENLGPEVLQDPAVITATAERDIANQGRLCPESSPPLDEKCSLPNQVDTRDSENACETESQSGIAASINHENELERPLHSETLHVLKHCFMNSSIREKLAFSEIVPNVNICPGDEKSYVVPLEFHESSMSDGVVAGNNQVDVKAAPSVEEFSHVQQHMLSEVMAPLMSKTEYDCRRPLHSRLENQGSLSTGSRLETMIPEKLMDGSSSFQGNCVQQSVLVRSRCSEDLASSQKNVQISECEAMVVYSEADGDHCEKTLACSSCVDQEGQSILFPNGSFLCSTEKNVKETEFESSRRNGACCYVNVCNASSISKNAESSIIKPESMEDSSKRLNEKGTSCTSLKQGKPKIFRRRSKIRNTAVIPANSDLSFAVGSSLQLETAEKDTCVVSSDFQKSTVEVQVDCINSVDSTDCDGAFSNSPSVVSLPLRIQPSRRCKKTPVIEPPQRLRKLKCRNSVFLGCCPIPLSLEKQLLKSESLPFLKAPVVCDVPVIVDPVPLVPVAKQAEVRLPGSSELQTSVREPLLLRRLSIVASRLTSGINIRDGCHLNRSAEMKLATPKIPNRFRSKLMNFFPSVSGWSKLHRNCSRLAFQTSFESPKREHFMSFGRRSTSRPVVHLCEYKCQTFTTPKFPACVLLKFKFLPLPDSDKDLQHCETSDKLTLQAGSVEAGMSEWTFSVFLPLSSPDVDQHTTFFLNKLQVCPESLKSFETVCSSQVNKDSLTSIGRHHSGLGLHTVLALSSPGCYRLWTRRRKLLSSFPAIQRLLLEQFVGLKGLHFQAFLAEKLFTSVPFSVARIMSIWSQHGPAICPASVGDAQLKSTGWFPALDTHDSPSPQLTCSGIPEAGSVLSKAPTCVTEISSTELPTCSLHLLHVSPVLHSEASAIVEVKEESDVDKVKTTTKKVSQIKIRKAVPRPDPNLTPMGLPKPKRVTKKEFSLEEIYTNKNYKGPPASRCLETIFEEPKEKNGSLICISHQKRKRVLDFQDFTGPRKRRARSGVKVTVGRTRGQKAVQDDEALDILLVQKLSDLENYFAEEEAGYSRDAAGTFCTSEAIIGAV